MKFPSNSNYDSKIVSKIVPRHHTRIVSGCLCISLWWHTFTAQICHLAYMCSCHIKWLPKLDFTVIHQCEMQYNIRALQFIFSNTTAEVHTFSAHKYLTLNMRGLNYLCSTRSISWLLMPLLLSSPGHQQPWHWLCRIGRSLSYLRMDFNYLCHINVEEWHKM